MITQDAFTLGHGIVRTILIKMQSIGLWRMRFIEEILLLFIGLKGRINFLQLSRYGYMTERSYRNQFEKQFDFINFNAQLIKTSSSGNCVIGFDPTFISKSGKRTPGLGYFYSGCAGSYKKGLELGCISVIDVKQNTAYHLEAVQSPSLTKRERKMEGKSLIDHYASIIISRAVTILSISNILVVDAYFTKFKFIETITNRMNMEVISRLRNDANLRYIYTRKPRTGKGRPKKYDGKIDVKNIDKRRIKKIFEDQEVCIHGDKVFSVGLKRDILLCYVEFKKPDGSIITSNLYFSTNLEQDPVLVLNYYRARFQMEFMFRDAKQYTGLDTCQARSENKMHFHYNASLTAVSVAKAIIRKSNQKDQELAFSIADIQTELHNRALALTIFSIYGIDPKFNENKDRLRLILDYGKIAA